MMKNKRALKIIAVTIAVIFICMSLVSCASRLSGTYVSTEDPNTVYKFSFFSDKLIYTFGEVVDIEGTYEIEGDKIYLTILGDRIEKTFEKDGSALIIDGVKFVKKK